MAGIVQTENLSKIYQLGKVPVRALDQVDLTIEEGDFLSITGPSGSGKSTLLNMIGLLDRPSSGEIFIKGRKVSFLTQTQMARFRLLNLGFIFQFFNLFLELTALENVMLPHMMTGRPIEECGKRAEELLEKVGLGDRVQHKPAELSGGQQQRVAVARALVNAPEILIADEPTGKLDTKTAEQVLKLISDLNQEGHTIILVTHEERLARMAKRMIKLVDGRIVEETVLGGLN